ncbi:YfjI family protein [Paraburkholderia youngii]|uniref:YfjI family protein n=1 Tax=Paraburkholderia youngii TaxID=2782701 RepID=UPI003D22D746
MTYISDSEYEAALQRSAFVKKGQENAALRLALAEARKAGEDVQADWPPFEPLPDSLRPVASFDFAMLPEALQPWARDIVKRVQCPPDFIGATIIGALGIAVGRRVGIRPKRRDSWTEFANVWVCIVGRPGQLKSPAMNAVLAPLRRLELDAAGRFEDERALFEAQSKVVRMRQDAAERAAMTALRKDLHVTLQIPTIAAPEAPKLTRYVVNDATVEKLGEICAENPQGVGVVRDELVSLLKSLDREGQEAARGFYLTGWNGNDGYTVDRIGRGHQRIEAVCLSLIGTTQPGRISEYLRDAVSGGAADDGLIQRFGVLVWPDPPRDKWENVDVWPDGEAAHAAAQIFKRLANDDPVKNWDAEISRGPDDEPDGNPPFLRFDDDAAEAFVEWRHELEDELRRDDLHPALESHLAKFRKLVPSLALIFHLAEGRTGAVGETAVTRALAVAHYLRSHAERAYAAVMLAEVDGAKALLKRIRAGDLCDGFTARDVYRKQWSRLENREAALRALNVLAEYGYVRTEAQETGGREKRVYRIHPEVR